MEPTGRIFTDTSEYYDIGPGDEIQVGGRRFLVTGEEREYRFGIEDPKFWVKKAIDRDTQERKILKLSFAESFMTQLGRIPVHCFRDPAKEAAILKLVAGHPEFMQGSGYTDSRGNIVRVLDIVRGINFLNHVVDFRMPHEVYFQTTLPDILRHLIPAIDAIGFLHQHGFRHGDLRNDHVYVTREDGRYVWIDFDYDFELKENPFGLDIIGLGNLLIYSIGKGFHDQYMLATDTYTYGDLLQHLSGEDFSILHKARLVNLRKLYPYIPPMLNNMLLHFSRGANVFYENAQEIVEDLKGYLDSI
jgi:hypothetical protein